MERSSPQAWNRPAPSSETLVPGKRDGWPLADRTHDGKRVWHEGSGCRPANALRRSFVAINRLWVERPVYAHLSRVGSRSSRAVLPICGRSFVASLLHQLSAGYRRDSSKFLAMNLSMEQQIEETIAVCDLVRGQKRSPKKLWLSFDEWNVWYRARSGDATNGHRQEAPHLLEEVYNLEDALLVGGLVNSLLRHADRVKVACLAQLINVIAPIMTNANGLFRQTIYYPYNGGLQYARGSVLNLWVESPTYEVSNMGQFPTVDVR